jgi:hypothetical protein
MLQVPFDILKKIISYVDDNDTIRNLRLSAKVFTNICDKLAKGYIIENPKLKNKTFNLVFGRFDVQNRVYIPKHNTRITYKRGKYLTSTIHLLYWVKTIVIKMNRIEIILSKDGVSLISENERLYVNCPYRPERINLTYHHPTNDAKYFKISRDSIMFTKPSAYGEWVYRQN